MGPRLVWGIYMLKIDRWQEPNRMDVCWMHEVGSEEVCDVETGKGLEVALSSPPCWCRLFERKTLFDDACTLEPGISEEKVLRI